ncbi:MAG TPA: CDP-glucose 4,6-dehydratase [Candidatus Eremiobacteraceae bacterium]|nr:CDP-glucose 4,6-dehydratase [Candidatus Eremiobacteraceae bacterium]
MNRRFWKRKRAFVTGHTGFKGGWLCAWLLDAGADVAGYALAVPDRPSLFESAGLGRDAPSTIADVRDRDRLAGAVRAHRPEIIFHLAAQPLVRVSYERPVETYAVNVMGTAHVLDVAGRAESLAAVVVVTSDKCYRESGTTRPHMETDPLGGDDPYSASKACAEIVTDSYRRSFAAGRGVASARAGNVIGGGAWAADRLIPDLVRAFVADEPARIRRPGDIRPWQHVLDPLAGYLQLGQSLIEQPNRFSQAWNFGPSAANDVAVRDVAALAAARWGDGATWTTDAGAHPPERAALRLDSTKATHELGWRPRLPLDASIAWTVDWYRAAAAGAGARDLIFADIARFEDLAA